MKKSKNLLKILALLILIGNIVNTEYVKENGEIYYRMPHYEIESKVKDIDTESFETLDGENYIIYSEYYAKDNKNVYFLGKKLKDVSSKGFEILDTNYVKDDKNVYELILDDSLLFFGDEIDTRKVEIDRLDVKSFKKLENSYYIDNYSVYFLYEKIKKIEEADRDSFEILENSYIGKDRNNIYYKGKKLENVDSKSFKNFDNFIGKDKNRVFFIEKNKEIINVDVKSFEILENSNYFKDKNNIFVRNEIDYNPNLEKLNHIDKDSFIILTNAIGKDKNGVYYMGEKIYGINPDNSKIIKDLNSDNYIFQSDNNYYLVSKKEEWEQSDSKKKVVIENIDDLKIDFGTFDYFGVFPYYKDKNSFYFYTENNFKKIQSDIDAKNAENFNNFLVDFVKDNKNIYYLNNDEIRKVDSDIEVDSLEVFESDDWYKNYVKDRKNIYFIDSQNGTIKKVKNADYSTFKIVKSNYGTDKNNVFYEGEKLDFITSDGFKILNRNYLKDNKNVYEIHTTDDNKTKIKIIKDLNIDVSSFKSILGGDFYKDKNSVYYVDTSEDKSVLKKLEGADSKTFQAGIFSKDKNNVYYGTNILKGVSSNGFEILNIMPLIVKDNKNVYYLETYETGIAAPTILNLKDMDVTSLKSIGNSFYDNIYYRDENNVYFITIDSNQKVKFEKLSGANSKTFETFDSYEKDDKNVYISGNKLDGIDVKSFEKLSYNIIKDKNGVYFLDAVEENETFKIEVQKIKIEGIDFKTFINVDNSDQYYKDKNNVYYKKNDNMVKIKNSDVKTFEILSEYPGYYAKDKNNVYFKGKKLEKIDSKTFETMQNNFVKDRNGVYIIEEKENGESKAIPINEKIDFESFEKAEESYNADYGNYYKDKDNIYYVDENGFKKLEGADVNSFERIENTFIYKDKNNAYYNGKILDGTDVESVKEIAGFFIADKNNVYYGAEKLENISPKNFSYFSGGLSYNTIIKDKNGIYKFFENENEKSKIKTIKTIPLDNKGIDLNSIERIDSPMNSSDYFKDRNGIYYMDGEKFINLNVEDKDHFEVTLMGKYGKDKNAVYYQDKKMDGVNPNEFEELDFKFSKYKNDIYIDGIKLENFEAKDFEILDEKKFRYKNEIYYYDNKNRTVKKEK